MLAKSFAYRVSTKHMWDVSIPLRGCVSGENLSLLAWHCQTKLCQTTLDSLPFVRRCSNTFFHKMWRLFCKNVHLHKFGTPDALHWHHANMRQNKRKAEKDCVISTASEAFRNHLWGCVSGSKHYTLVMVRQSWVKQRLTAGLLLGVSAICCEDDLQKNCNLTRFVMESPVYCMAMMVWCQRVTRLNTKNIYNPISRSAGWLESLNLRQWLKSISHYLVSDNASSNKYCQLTRCEVLLCFYYKVTPWAYYC